MNQKTIQKLRIKILLISMLSLILAMLFIGTMINLASFYNSREQIKAITTYIIDKQGEIDEDSESVDHIDPDSDVSVETGYQTGADWLENNGQYIDSPEFRYSIRYFSTIYTLEGNVESVNVEHIASVNEETAETYCNEALDRISGFGKIDSYYYEKGELEDGREIVVFLDSSLQISTNNDTLRSTVLVCGVGSLITFILMWFLSKKAIKPEIDNMKRQKQFITNASHELKTPIAVIRANTEVEEMISGETEWTRSTMRQVERLNGLVQNLVMITRSEEQEDSVITKDVDVTKAVNESVDPYASLALQSEIALERHIEDDVHMDGDESQVRQLAAILVDNAVKYCDEKGHIDISLEQQKKHKQIKLSVSNSYKDGESIDYNKFFERFYRGDQSHSVDKGGYGIGLSMAESICKQYSGTIGVSWKDGIITFTCLFRQ